MDVQEWIETFKEREDPNDNTFSSTYKQATNDAKDLDQQLKAASREIKEACIVYGRLDKKFLDDVMTFSTRAASNEILKDKMKSLQQQSEERGICLQPTNITVDQIKGQLPTFNGASPHHARYPGLV